MAIKLDKGKNDCCHSASELDEGGLGVKEDEGSIASEGAEPLSTSGAGGIVREYDL